jgi:benzoyl-CoA reductase/2-hydroxyglutaryl-CoA dehydratase subunit BcrC/BadD/HgdB
MDFRSFFDNIVTGVGKKLEEKTTGRRLMAFHTARLAQRLFSGEHPVVWVNVTIPFEIINAFPVASTYAEFIGAALAGAEMAEPFIERAESEGFTTDGCSYHRALLGAFLNGVLPKPIGVISATCPCDGGLKSVAEIGRLADVPEMFLHVPLKSKDEGIAYLADQMRQMVAFMEKVTGEKFDRERFGEIIKLSNETADVLKRVYKYGEMSPTPYDGKALKNFQIVMLPLMGTDAGMQIAKQFEKEFSENAASGTPGMKNEKLRFLWIQNRIQFPNTLLDELEAKFGANIVWDELNDIYWEPIDPSDPFEGLARRLIENPLGGDLSIRIETLKKRAKQYKIDGAIHPCHWGCRQSQNVRSLLEKALNEVGVPMIALDVDCVDKRSFAPGQLTTRLEAFCEML